MVSINQLPYIYNVLQIRFNNLIATQTVLYLKRYRCIYPKEKERYIQFMIDDTVGIIEPRVSIEYAKKQVSKYNWCKECSWVVESIERHEKVHKCIDAGLFHKGNDGRWNGWCCGHTPNEFAFTIDAFDQQMYWGSWKPISQLEWHMLRCEHACDAIAMPREKFQEKHGEMLKYNTRLYNGETTESIELEETCKKGDELHRILSSCSPKAKKNNRRLMSILRRKKKKYSKKRMTSRQLKRIRKLN